MADLEHDSENNVLLLKQFNNRDSRAFGDIYMLYANELLYFTKRICLDTDLVANDVIHDVFIKIWTSDKLKFSSLSNIKGYLLVSIKNYFRDYVKHKKCVSKFNDEILKDDDYFVAQVVESETLSILSEALKLLPTECAKVFELHINGWNTEDIAELLQKTTGTVYKQKERAISILKKKLSEDKMIILNFFYF